MGSGMLWAAIGGGAKAYDEVLDVRAKEEAAARARTQSFADRREIMLQEMELKSKFAQQEEDRVAGVLNKIDERGRSITNERGARELTDAANSVPTRGDRANEEITPEMIAAMPKQARDVYEKEMGLTDDSPLQSARDRVVAAGEVGAPQTIRKGLLDTVKQEQLAEQKAAEQARLERKMEQDAELAIEREDRRDAREAAQAESSERMSANRLAAQMERAQAVSNRTQSGVDQTQKLSVLKDVVARGEASKPVRKDYRSEAKFSEAMDKWAASDSGKMAQQASARILSIFDEAAAPGQSSVGPLPGEVKTPWVGDREKAEQVRIISAELEKARSTGNTGEVAALERELARLGAPPSGAATPKPAKPAAGDNIGTPPISLLQPGKVVKFKNGQKWTLEGGKPKRIE